MLRPPLPPRERQKSMRPLWTDTFQADMQHGVGKGLHDVDVFVKSWIQLFCGQNALIVPLWCASEQWISNKTRMTATFTSHKVNVNLHSIRDLFKMTFKKRNQNKWLWQKNNDQNCFLSLRKRWQKILMLKLNAHRSCLKTIHNLSSI